MPASAEPSLLENPHLRRWGPAAAIALLAFLFLLPTLRGVYIWDDDQWLTANPSVQQISGLAPIWLSPSANPQYYPLVFTTFWMEHQLWKLDPAGYHFDNLMLHIGAALILFHLLKRLKLPGGVLGAWLATAIFAVHPVVVESVAWVAERKNVLCAVFFFAAMLYGLQFFKVIEPEGYAAADDAERGRAFDQKNYWKAIGLFLAAMLSKTIACVMPPALLVMIWWRRGKITAREWLLAIPFFVIAGGLGLITTGTEHGAVGTTGEEWIYSPVGRMLFAHPEQATGSLKLEAAGQEIVARTLIASQAVWFYVGKLFWPYPVMQVYPRFSYDVYDGALYVAPAALLIVLIVLFVLRRKITRGPFAAVLLFIGLLFPALGYINFYTMVYTFVTDHYQYLACPVIIVLAVETILWALRKASVLVPTDTSDKEEGARRFFNLTSGLLAGVIVLSLGVLANAVSNLYTNAEVLWSFNVFKNPTAYAAWNNLATAILNRPATTGADTEQNRAEALDALQHSMKAAPQDWRAYHTAGMIYLDQNKPELAAQFLDKAESLMPAFVRNGRANFFVQQAEQATAGAAPAKTNDVFYSPNFLLGRNFEDHEQWDKAIACYQADAAVNPKNPEADFHLGNCYIGKNDFATAITAYNRAIEKRPRYAEAYFNRGVCLRALGKEKEGVADLMKAHDLDPMVLVHVPGLLNEEARQFRHGPGPATQR